MTTYDPYIAPDPKEWLVLDEQRRTDRVLRYHRHIQLPNPQAHAVMHVVVENQLAYKELPVCRALERLIDHGFDRHTAIHAIGGTLCELIDVAHLGQPGGKEPSLSEYYAALDRLTAESWLASFEDETRHQWIIGEFAARDPFPAAAIRAARAERAIMVPLFLELIEKHIAGTASAHEEDALFIIFHLLGEWREKSAYRPLARMLRLPEEEIAFLGDAITETSQRVMAAVFDGDPQPLYDVIRDPQAYEFVRSAMCKALAIATLRADFPREEMARFLRAGASDIVAEHGSHVWYGWQSCVAVLGLAELRPLVEQAFKEGKIDEFSSTIEYFEEDLHRAMSGAPPRFEEEFRVFGDTIEELARSWLTAREYDALDWDEEDEELDFSVDDEEFETAMWMPPRPSVPVLNPFKRVGRNDPCPCGSGKKYKKCCLNSAEAAE